MKQECFRASYDHADSPEEFFHPEEKVKLDERGDFYCGQCGAALELDEECEDVQSLREKLQAK